MFIFRPLTEQDLPRLYSWFKKPHVTKWWPMPEAYKNFFDHFLTWIRSKSTHPFLVLANNVPIAYLQYYHIDRTLEKTGSWLPDLPTITIGTDQFISEKIVLAKDMEQLLSKHF